MYTYKHIIFFVLEFPPSPEDVKIKPKHVGEYTMKWYNVYLFLYDNYFELNTESRAHFKEYVLYYIPSHNLQSPLHN